MDSIIFSLSASGESAVDGIKCYGYESLWYTTPGRNGGQLTNHPLQVANVIMQGADMLFQVRVNLTRLGLAPAGETNRHAQCWLSADGLDRASREALKARLTGQTNAPLYFHLENGEIVLQVERIEEPTVIDGKTFEDRFVIETIYLDAATFTIGTNAQQRTFAKQGSLADLIAASKKPGAGKKAKTPFANASL